VKVAVSFGDEPDPEPGRESTPLEAPDVDVPLIVGHVEVASHPTPATMTGPESSTFVPLLTAENVA
jgi:hypothetical protein